MSKNLPDSLKESLSRQCQTQAEFNDLASILKSHSYTHLPIMREILADQDTPVSTYLKLANKPYTYLFESVVGGDKLGRYSIIGLPCHTVYKVFGNEVVTQVDGNVVNKEIVSDPLQAVRELQQQYNVVELEHLPEMVGGLVGYFGYETIGYMEPRLAGKNKPDVINAPDILLMLSMDVMVFDNVSQRLYLVNIADLNDPQAFSKAQKILDDNIVGLTGVNDYSGADSATEKVIETIKEGDYKVHFPQADFEKAVERCRDYIHEGDMMQVVLSQRLSTEYRGKSFDIYRALRMINPSPYMYFVNLDDFEIVGSSPEILVRLQKDIVTVRPIAGTRKRGLDESHDKALEQELLADEKELAEHLMLIDLGRNDTGRIAQTGTVKLTEKMMVERYSHVMHIVSNVEGKLKPEYDAIDVLKATFPAGTVSGAPKIRAMEIIAELEPVKRGIYSGAIGYLGWNGNMDTAIAIRTAVIKDGTLYIQAGAGIVADSVPEYEWKETLSKARAIFKAVELASSGLKMSSTRVCEMQQNVEPNNKELN